MNKSAKERDCVRHFAFFFLIFTQPFLIYCSENSSSNRSNAPILAAKDSNDSASPRGSLVADAAAIKDDSSPAHRALVAKDSSDSLSSSQVNLMQAAGQSRRSSVEEGPESRGSSPAPESDSNSRRSSATNTPASAARHIESPPDGLLAVLKETSPRASLTGPQGPRQSMTAGQQPSNQPERGSLSPLLHTRSSISSPVAAAQRPSTVMVGDMQIDSRLVKLAASESQRRSATRASTAARGRRTPVGGRRRSSGDDYGDGEGDRPFIDRDAMPRIQGTARTIFLDCTDRCCMRDEDRWCTSPAEQCLAAAVFACLTAGIILALTHKDSAPPIMHYNITDSNPNQLEFHAKLPQTMPVLSHNATIAYRVCNATTPNQRKRSLKALKKMLGRQSAKQAQRNSNAHNKHFNNNSRKK